MTTDHGSSTIIDEIRGLAVAAADAASTKKASDIRILDVQPLVGITDYFVLLSAANERQLRTIAEEISGVLKRDHRRAPLRREGTAEAGWVLLDYGDIVVHVFGLEQRAFYGLERLWSDAPAVPWTDPAGVSA